MEMNALPLAARQLRKVDRKQARTVRRAVTKRADRDGLRAGMWVRVVLNRYSAFSKASDHLERAREAGGTHPQQRLAD
jgi:hypothetical protein